MLRVYISAGSWGYEVDAPVVRVGTPMLTDFGAAIDLKKLPDIALPDATPAPTLIPSRIAALD